MADDALVITGPTATGKTAVGIAVAQALGGEIISMDSRQVYQGMDIGTAKPTVAERQGIPHHGLDVVTPAERYSAGRFGRDARRWIQGIRGRGNIPIVVGGTGFFLRALTHPLFHEPQLPPARRALLDRYLRTLDTERLRRWSDRLDPALAKRRRPGDRQRQARAIEVALLTGRPLSWWYGNAPPKEPPLALRIFVLEMPADVLRARIDARVHRMIDAGLVEEVAALRAAGYDDASPGMSATGYVELLPYLRGEYDLVEAVAQIQAATRRYARRQRTWLRHQIPDSSIRLDAREAPEALAAHIVRWWREENP